MRKKTFLLFICLISLLSLRSSDMANEGILLKYFPKDSILKETLPSNYNRMLDEMIILPEQSFQQQEAASIIARIDQLPASLLKKLKEEHVYLKLFTGLLTDNSSADHLHNVVPRGYKNNKKWDDVPGIGGGRIVLVKIGSSEKGKGHGSVNLELHELAHSIDRYVYGEIRHNPFFLKIWQEEKDRLFPNQTYLESYGEEYFAESFAMYYLNPVTREQLKESAPRTFLFIKSLR